MIIIKNNNYKNNNKNHNYNICQKQIFKKELICSAVRGILYFLQKKTHKIKKTVHEKEDRKKVNTKNWMKFRIKKMNQID